MAPLGLGANSLHHAFDGFSINVIDSDTPITHVWPKGLGSSIFECSALLPSGRQLLADPMSLLLESNEERAIGHYEQWLKQATFGGREGDTSPHHDMVMLHRIVHALANSSSLITLETGFANGGSTVAILAAHDAHGTHVSIDPCQNNVGTYNYGATGLRGVQTFLAARRQHHRDAPTFVSAA